MTYVCSPRLRTRAREATSAVNWLWQCRITKPGPSADTISPADFHQLTVLRNTLHKIPAVDRDVIGALPCPTARSCRPGISLQKSPGPSETNVTCSTRFAMSLKTAATPDPSPPSTTWTTRTDILAAWPAQSLTPPPVIAWRACAPLLRSPVCSAICRPAIGTDAPKTDVRY